MSRAADANRSSDAVDRVVVVHGTVGAGTARALASVGLVVRLELGDTTVWTPAHWAGVPARVSPSGPPDGLDPAPRLLLTIAEAAAVLGVGRTTAYELVGSGQLEVVHVGRCARVPVDAVKELVERLRDRKTSMSLPAGTVALPGTTGASQPSAAYSDRRAGRAS